MVFESSVVKDSLMHRILSPFILCSFLMWSGDTQAAIDAMNAVAERYAHLGLAPGQHDPDYVDAFYVEGAQTEKEKKSLDAIGAEAAEPIAILAKTPDATTGSWKAVLTAPHFLISLWRLRCARSPICRRAF
jgi:hypothetical protein